MEDWSTSVMVAIAGGLGGILLGLAARLGRFCTLTAIEDALFGGDLTRLRMWTLAIALAIAGVGVFAVYGNIDFSQSIYNRLPPNPVAWVAGGLMFGFGMALCGTCGYGTLARIGGGDLRALFGFFILGVAAFMAVAGPTAHLRVLVVDPFALGDAMPYRTLSDLQSYGAMAPLLAALVVAAALASWCFASARFRSSLRHIFWGAMVGVAVLSGWVATAYIGADPFHPQPLASHTFSVPLGQTIIYFMTMSGATLTFGIGGTLGVVVGSFIGALIRREFRWEGADDAREMRRHIVGAFLMGTGGVYAGGCTIGQGVSAASVLAVSAPVVMASIGFGAWLGLCYVMEGSIWAGLRALVNR